MVRGLTVVRHNLPNDGFRSAYYPETQPLIALEDVDPDALTPYRRSVPVRVARDALVGLRTQHPKGLDFGARPEVRSPEGREDFRRCIESAIAVPGPEYDLDVAGHYARPDAFNLSVDTRPKGPVSFAAGQDEVTPFSWKTRQATEIKEGTGACLD